MQHFWGGELGHGFRRDRGGVTNEDDYSSRAVREMQRPCPKLSLGPQEGRLAATLLDHRDTHGVMGRVWVVWTRQLIGGYSGAESIDELGCVSDEQDPGFAEPDFERDAVLIHALRLAGR